MTDIIMNILQWAIPSGGIGAAIAWIANRKVKQAEQAKKIHDTYKEMYGDISKELLENQKKLDESTRKNEKAIDELNKENARTRHALNRLSRAIEAIQLCPHRATCPVSSELQNDEDDADGAEPGRTTKKRQRKSKSGGGGKPREPDDNVDATDTERHGEAEHING